MTVFPNFGYFVLFKRTKSTKKMIKLVGTVIHGKKIGRTIDFPTANLNIKNHPLKLAAVYCGYAYLKEQKYKMVLCVNWENIIEVHLLDYSGEEFYDVILEITITHFIRNMEQISDLNRLKQTIQYDVDYANFLLN